MGKLLIRVFVGDILLVTLGSNELTIELEYLINHKEKVK